MSDFASVVEQARRAFASVAKLEGILARDPESVIVQVNLAAAKKLALKSQEQLQQLAEYQRVEVCNYRLVPVERPSYGLSSVSKSFIGYQDLFTQIHDAIKNGPRQRAGYGQEAKDQSRLELAYTYSGSLGVVLFAQSEHDFFGGSLDASIETLFDVLEIGSRSKVRQIAQDLGPPVIKRVHDWSKANMEGGFSTDVVWKRSDGRHLGRLVERDTMEEIVNLIEATSDQEVEIITTRGILVGGNIKAGTFHFVEPEGEDYRGIFAKDFTTETELILGRPYKARIRQISTVIYATEEVRRTRELLSLSNLSDPPSLV